MKTLHKKFDADEDGKREIVFYCYDGVTVTKLRGKSLLAFFETFTGGVIRMTSVASLDQYVQMLTDMGATIQYAHWHDTGIDKNSSPEDVVKAYHALPEDIFRTFAYDADLAQLRRIVDERNAIDQFYNDALRKLRQVGRNCGRVEIDEDEDFQQSLEALDGVAKLFKIPGVNDKLVSYETRIKQLASKNPLCVLFNKVAGIGDSWITAASIVSLTQGIDRFPGVAQFWSYFGMGDAEKQKRRKGQPSNWSARGRLVCYQLGESIIKNKNNPWRLFFDEAKAEYLAKHTDACCKAAKGHPHAQARRKMVKEILKRFYLAASGVKYDSDHSPRETHYGCVAVGAAAGN